MKSNVRIEVWKSYLSNVKSFLWFGNDVEKRFDVYRNFR